MKSLITYINNWFTYLLNIFIIVFMTHAAKNLEIIALRSQLALLTEQLENKKIKKPRANRAYRQLWVLISKFQPNWKPLQNIFKPDTITRWQKTAFKLHWKKKSKPIGRPPLSKEIIAQIKSIHKDNPLLSPEKIHELLVSLGISNAPAPNTIAKYIPDTRKPPSEKQKQSWRTFLKNHSKDIWAMD